MTFNLDITKEAVRRCLESGMLTSTLPFNPAQREALESYMVFLSSDIPDRNRGYFDMATGLGKTGLISAITRHSFIVSQELGISNEFKAVILEPTISLIDQTGGELVKIAPELDSAYGVYGGGVKDFTKPVTIMSFHAWVDLQKSGELNEQGIFQKYSDEAQHGLSQARQDLINDGDPNTVYIGVSASTQFDEHKTLERTHRNLIYKMSLRDAVENGWLTKYIHVQYFTLRILPSLVSREALPKKDHIPLRRGEWSKLIANLYSTGTDIISGRPLSKSVGMFYGADTNHADDLAAMLNTNPHLTRVAAEQGFSQIAESIHGVNISRSLQRDRLSSFKAGGQMAATGDEMLKAGFDYPRVKLIASFPGGSLVDCIQQMGRATRPYTDTQTGEELGTVIICTIPYVGDADPLTDRRNRNNALARCITPYDILKTSLVLAPGYVPAHYDNDKSTPRDRFILSPGIEVESFITEERTLTITRRIENARKTQRVVITDEMIDAVNEQITACGNYTPTRLLYEVERYESEHGLAKSGITIGNVQSILYGNLRTIEGNKWLRFEDVIVSLPYINPGEQIALTPNMVAGLRAKVGGRGSFGAARLLEEIETYEIERNINGTGITLRNIEDMLLGGSDTVDINQWIRINDVIETLPPIVDLSKGSKERKIFDELVARKGHPSAIRIFSVLPEHATQADGNDAVLFRSYRMIENVLEGTQTKLALPRYEALIEGLTKLPDAADAAPMVSVEEGSPARSILDRLLSEKGNPGSVKIYALLPAASKPPTENALFGSSSAVEAIIRNKGRLIPQARLEALLSTLELMPTVGMRIELTDAMLKEFRDKVSERGNYGSNRLAQAVVQYEEENKLEGCGIEQKLIQRVLDGGKSILAIHWERLSQAIDNIPIGGFAPRIEFTEERKIWLKEKIAERGNYGPAALFQAIRNYELENNLPEIPMKLHHMDNIIGGIHKTIDLGHWNRIDQVLEWIPIGGFKPRVTLTPDMWVEFREKVESKGEYGYGRLAAAVENYEREHRLPSTGLNAGHLQQLMDGTGKTFDEEHWRRINEVVAWMPAIASADRIELAPEILRNLKDKVNLRGGFGAILLTRKLRQWEDENGLSNTGITSDNLGTLLTQKQRGVKTFDKAQWKRLNEFLDALPVVDVAKVISVTDNMVEDLIEKIKKNGNYGVRRLLNTIKQYEQQNDLADIGISENFLRSLLERRKTKRVDIARWNRLHEVVASIPVGGFLPRVKLTPQLLYDLSVKIDRHGKYGSGALIREITRYETENNLPSVGISQSILENIINGNALKRLNAGRVATIDGNQWKRLHDTLDTIPIGGWKPRIVLSQRMVEGINEKIKLRGEYGHVRIWQEVEKYEAAKDISGVGLSRGIIQNILSGTAETVDPAQWTRLNIVVDAIPLKARARIEFSDEMRSSLNAKMVARGNIGATLLVRAIEAYEIQHRLPTLGLTPQFLNRLIYPIHTAKAIGEAQWERINAVLDNLSPDQPLRNLTKDGRKYAGRKAFRKAGFGSD